MVGKSFFLAQHFEKHAMQKKVMNIHNALNTRLKGDPSQLSQKKITDDFISKPQARTIANIEIIF